ncbi:MAG: zf-TFIIB domain-containing protein, partial [Planctomycetes bacterium]|nr:zf-TFIIB domain-containing protein [Planctomycetota bacterium]
TMVSLQIRASEKTYLERCEDCLGIFFDPSELEALLDASVSHVHRINLDRLKLLAQRQDSSHDHIVKYVKCPVCEELMNRRCYGPRSAVVVDTCKNHGVWLDGGELRKLLNWTKAGGELYRTKREDDEQRTRESRKRRLPPQGLSSVSWNDQHDDSPIIDMASVGRAVGLLLRWLI